MPLRGFWPVAPIHAAATSPASSVTLRMRAASSSRPAPLCSSSQFAALPTAAYRSVSAVSGRLAMVGHRRHGVGGYLGASVFVVRVGVVLDERGVDLRSGGGFPHLVPDGDPVCGPVPADVERAVQLDGRRAGAEVAVGGAGAAGE